MYTAYQATDQHGQNVLLILTDGVSVNLNRYTRPRLLGAFHDIVRPPQCLTPANVTVRNRRGSLRFLNITQPNDMRPLYYVNSESGETYIVQKVQRGTGLLGDRTAQWNCNCKDYVIRRIGADDTCYHIDGVQQAIRQQAVGQEG